MSTELDRAITALAVRFATDVVSLVRRSRPEDIVRVRKNGPTADIGIYRRSQDELTIAARRIVAVVRTQRDGATAEMIKAKLGLPTGRSQSKIFSTPLSIALGKGWLRKRGERRNTRYFVP